MNCKKCNNELTISLLYSSKYYLIHNDWLYIYQCANDNSLWTVMVIDNSDVLIEVIPVDIDNRLIQ